MLTGMNAAVRVQLKENDGRLLIPLAAVQEDANGIYVCTGYDKSSDEATDPIEITTGLSDGEKCRSPLRLSEGDTVYYRYADTLEYSFGNKRRYRNNKTKQRAPYNSDLCLLMF